MKSKVFNFDDYPNGAGSIEVEEHKSKTTVRITNKDNQCRQLFTVERDQWGTFYNFFGKAITIAHEDYSRSVGESLLKVILYILTNNDPEYSVSKEKILEKLSNILEEI